MSQQLKQWLFALDRVEEKLTQVPDFRQYGKLTRATGLVMEAVGLKLPIGALCIVERQTEQGIIPVESEVVGFNGQTLFLMPLEHVDGILPGARIYALQSDSHAGKQLPVGPHLLGRVLDAQVDRWMAAPRRGNRRRGCLPQRSIPCTAIRSKTCSTLACVPSMAC